MQQQLQLQHYSSSSSPSCITTITAAAAAHLEHHHHHPPPHHHHHHHHPHLHLRLTSSSLCSPHSSHPSAAAYSSRMTSSKNIVSMTGNTDCAANRRPTENSNGNGSGNSEKCGTSSSLYRRLLHWLRRKARSKPPPRLAAGHFGWYTVTATKRRQQQEGEGDEAGEGEETRGVATKAEAESSSCWTSSTDSSIRNGDTSSDDGESGFEDDDGEDDDRTSPADREWCIPLSDLEFGERLVTGRRRAIYRGRWHGEVLIHTFTPRHELHVQRFLRQVTSLSMIRHENVALFMGACIEPACLAIVTSTPTGPSLFEFVHVRRESMLLTEKIRIGHQVAQAMGYLHAKTLVHGRLTSRNVFLEGRVQVSLLDQGLADTTLDRSECGCLPRGHMTYLSPELMRCLQVCPPRVTTSASATKQTDVYAFGTLLYELMTGQWPFRDAPSHVVIYRVANGLMPSSEMVKGPSSLKELLTRCWDVDPYQRPLFPKIVRMLQRSVALHRRFSSSEPERLNRLEYQRLAC